MAYLQHAERHNLGGSDPITFPSVALPFAIISQASNNATSSGFGTQDYMDLTSANFWSSDTSVFSSATTSQSGFPAGKNFLTINQTGTYLFGYSMMVNDAPGAAVANPVNQQIVFGYAADLHGGTGGNDSGLEEGTPSAVYGYTIDSNTVGTGFSEWDFSQRNAYSVGPSDVPTAITPVVSQNTGKTLSVFWNLWIVQLGTTNMFA